MDKYYIRGIKLSSKVGTNEYPMSIPAIQQIESVNTESQVTFLVGENGTGKSTIVEAIAVAAGFNAEGGTKNYSFSSQNSTSDLADNITLVRGVHREKYGYFLRAESFYTTANYSESGTFGMSGRPIPILFNGKHIHEQSHGEAFLSIVDSFRPGLFIFDEPESALSPQRIMTLMKAIHDLAEQGSQFIIATHSPILLAYPGARIYQLTSDGIEQVEYDQINNVKITKDFLNNPSLFTGKIFLN